MPFLALLVAMPAFTDGHDQRRGDQMRAYQARQNGDLLPQKEIERRVVPTVAGAEYLGLDLDDGRAVYKLRFVRNGTVFEVLVDGRSGRVIHPRP